MSWLKKLFGGGLSLAQLQQLVEQKRYADARLQAEQLLQLDLPAAEIQQVTDLLQAAGDGLARLNLEEALAMRRSGDNRQAEEHLQLALEQVASAELREKIEHAAQQAADPEVLAPDGAGAAACGGCGPTAAGSSAAERLELPDADSQLDLILTSYPVELAARYRQKSALFQQAFLLAHSGDDAAAMPLWQQVAASEQDELYWFELGAALARTGELKAARQALETALRVKPEFLLASEALVPVLLAEGDTATAESLLQGMLKKGQEPEFCHAQLCLLCLRQEQPDAALKHARKALGLGVVDPAFLPLAASLLEQTGDLAEAERVLRRLPAGGCGGGISLPLAEFLLRQQRELGKVLDTFNAACRQEPDNPRWQLRVAQTYLARRWKKEGLQLLRKVVVDPRLDAELQQEAKQLLAEQGG